MKTADAVDRFLKKCQERGLSPETTRTYYGYLRHFATDHDIIPTDTNTIEQFLKKRKETPAHRGKWFAILQAFYSYLEQFEEIKSPVPPKGKVGRPQKAKPASIPNPHLGSNISSPQNHEITSGGLSLSSSISISTVDAVNSLTKSRQYQGVSPRTLEAYRTHFKPFARKFPMLPLTSEPIEEFLLSIKGDIETRWSYRKDLATLYHFLEQRNKLPKGLVLIPTIKRPRKVRRVLSEDELRHLFAFTENFQETVILTLLIDAKIRAEELTTLVREKVYPDHVTVTGKTGERDAPINPDTYSMLIQLAPTGLLFRIDGRPMRREYLRKVVHRLMVRSGLEGKKLGPHILRHSASVQHMMFGGDLMSLKEELGHTQVSTTQIYAELASSQVKQRHQQVDVLGKLTTSSPLERARCYGCGQEVVVAMVDLKQTECPYCHQVGVWYTPNHQ